MDIDVGQIRFFTKVVDKAPRGLRLLLFKDKITNKEKLIFLVKTASEDVEKLALSKMTWIVEKSTINPRVILVKLLILPDGEKDFYKSETGLIITESKDLKSLEALSKQISVEIYFFNTEAEFHSKIELLTTPRMLDATKKFYEKAKLLDDSRALSKSDNISDLDMKNAIDAKNKVKVKSSDLDESIQKKMPTISDTSHIRSKSEESNKTSVKSSDVMQSGVSFQTSNVEKNNQYKSNDDKKSTSSLTIEDLKNAVSVPPGKITAHELSKTIPPLDKNRNSELTLEDLKNAVSIPPSKITADELYKTVPPTHKNKNSELTLEDLKNAVSIPPGKISAHELSKTIPPLDKNRNSELTLEDLKSAVSVPPSKITANELSKTIPPTPIVNKKSNEVSTSILDSFDFFNTEPTKPKETPPIQNTVIETQDLLSSLKQEPAPIPKDEPVLKSNSDVNNDNLFKTQDLLSLLKQEVGLADKIFAKNNKNDDLISSLKQEPTPIPKDEPVLKSNSDVNNDNLFKTQDLLSSLKQEPAPIPKDEPVLKSNSDVNNDNLFKTQDLLSLLKQEVGLADKIFAKNDKNDDLISSLKQEPTPIPKDEPVLKSNSYQEKNIKSDKISEETNENDEEVVSVRDSQIKLNFVPKSIVKPPPALNINPNPFFKSNVIKQELKNNDINDLLAELKQESTPIPKDEPVLKSNSFNNNVPSLKNDSKNSSNIEESNNLFKSQDLLSLLNQEPTPIPENEPVLKSNSFNDDLMSALKQESTPIPKDEPVLKSNSFNDDLMSALKQESTPIPKNEPVLKSNSFNNDLISSSKKESTEIKKDYLNNTVKLSSLINTGKIPKIEQDSLLNDLMSEPTPLPNIINTLNPTQPKNNKITLSQIEENEKKSISKIISEIDESKEISPEDLVRILGDL